MTLKITHSRFFLSFCRFSRALLAVGIVAAQAQLTGDDLDVDQLKDKAEDEKKSECFNVVAIFFAQSSKSQKVFFLAKNCCFLTSNCLSL